MGDPLVDQWSLEGHLFLFRFPNLRKGSREWHLSADALACQSMTNLIDLMLAASWKTRKRIPVSMPHQMLVKQSEQWKTVESLLLRYPQGEVAEDFWQISSPDADTCELTAGRLRMLELRESLLGLPNWKDDYWLGPEYNGCNSKNKHALAEWEDQRLWLWTKVG